MRFSHYYNLEKYKYFFQVKKGLDERENFQFSESNFREYSEHVMNKASFFYSVIYRYYLTETKSKMHI